MSALKVSILASLILGSHACQWDEQGYLATLLGGSIGGIVVGVLVVVLVSLPLCCGVLKEHGKAGHQVQVFLSQCRMPQRVAFALFRTSALCEGIVLLRAWEFRWQVVAGIGIGLGVLAALQQL